MGKPQAPGNALRVELRGQKERGSEKIVNGRVAEEEESLGAVMPHRDSQGPPDGMSVVERNLSKRGCATCWERTGDDNLAIEAICTLAKGE